MPKEKIELIRKLLFNLSNFFSWSNTLLYFIIPRGKFIKILHYQQKLANENCICIINHDWIKLWNYFVIKPYIFVYIYQIHARQNYNAYLLCAPYSFQNGCLCYVFAMRLKIVEKSSSCIETVATRKKRIFII